MAQLLASEAMIRLNIPRDDREVLKEWGFELQSEQPIGTSGVSSTVYLGKCNENAMKRLEVGTLQSLTGRLCAIKVTLARRETEAPLEARILETIRHPGIVDVYLNIKSSSHAIGGEASSLTTTYAQRYIVMEYMNGDTLCARLKPSQPLIPQSEAIAMFRQLSAGLQFLHDNNIVHKDIHAGNIMITSDEANNYQYKIVDFGSAELLPDLKERQLIHEQQMKKDMSMMASYFTMVLSKSNFEDESLKKKLRILWDDVQAWTFDGMGPVIDQINMIIDERPEVQTVADLSSGWADFEQTQTGDEDWADFGTGNADDEWGEFVG